MRTQPLAVSAISATPIMEHAGRAQGHAHVPRAADEVSWDYAPSGRDEAMGYPFDDDFSSMRILRCRGIHFDQPEVIQQRLRTGR